AKSQLAANSALPLRGNIFISVTDRHKTEVLPIARTLTELGYRLISTRGTASALRQAGIAVQEIPKIQEGRPNLLDLLKNEQIVLVINTPSGKGARTDEGKIRAAAVMHRVTCITTLPAAQAAVEACVALRQRELTVRARKILGVRRVPDGDEQAARRHVFGLAAQRALEAAAGHALGFGAEHFVHDVVPLPIDLGVVDGALLHDLAGAKNVAAVHEVN